MELYVFIRLAIVFITVIFKNIINFLFYYFIIFDTLMVAKYFSFYSKYLVKNFFKIFILNVNKCYFRDWAHSLAVNRWSSGRYCWFNSRSGSSLFAVLLLNLRGSVTQILLDTWISNTLTSWISAYYYL